MFDDKVGVGAPGSVGGICSELGAASLGAAVVLRFLPRLELFGSGSSRYTTRAALATCGVAAM